MAFLDTLSITFASDGHQAAYYKVAAFLWELTSRFGYSRSQPHFHFDQGSARVTVSVRPYMKNDALVEVCSWFLFGAPDAKTNVDLHQRLLRYNAESNFVRYGIDDDGDVCASYSLIASYCTRIDLGAAISAVANAADELDDKLQARFGGLRHIDKQTR